MFVGARRALLSAVRYQPETRALIARMTTAPTRQRARLLDALIVSMKAAGVWTKLDALYLLAAADSQAARLNIVQNAYNLSAVSSPTFVADRGYTGDGVASYLDTGFNPTTAPSPKFTLNSAHLAIWSRTNLISGTLFDAGNGNARINAGSNALNTMRAGLNDATLNNYGAVGVSTGHFALNRSASGALQGYRNGGSLASQTTASTALSNANILLLTNQTSYSTRQLPAAHFGQSLTATEIAAIYAALNVYLTAVGGA
ncbi:hypothetical protein C3941_19865 [Kaistia algarum]|uniref:hypothetical protein n=1 Tax=Kaistia algarum TaxID=2083279 RepID=UPI000CE7F759|nr:hypothetical protein [Kaistia algarum]MCX5516250.1 hypothetical protein [Kaistia algarum]PPE78320.1 hypothetical protein C3941_19865 [Kaistia algarum]